MKIVLLSGGSGKRLWPLSNDLRSKQFLPLLKRSDGGLESMVQRVWRQLTIAGLSQDSYLATSKAQEEILQSQIPNEVKIIVEPERRDTFPAIALVASYLYSIIEMKLDEVIVIMPVDPYVEQPFFDKLYDLEKILLESNADLALIGVNPSFPSEKYGYIIPEVDDNMSSQNEYYKVQQFREKPNKEEAAMMISQDAFWNCGVFAFKLGSLINLLIEKKLPIKYEEAIKQYSRFPKNSFDYEVVEKSKNIVVAPYKGSWKDLGTWNTLSEEIASPLIGMGTVTEDSINTHVINELEIPITVIGASNLIIAASPDGILVSDKDSSPRIKELLINNSQRPMYEERRWGRYRVLDYLKYDNGLEILTKRICVHEGKNLSYQYHNKRKEVWTVIAGTGEMILDGKYRKVTTGDVIIIPSKSLHSLKALSEVEIIEVQSGTELVEEDIVRLAINWGDILHYSVV